jgi:hypothetical protein
MQIFPRSLHVHYFCFDISKLWQVFTVGYLRTKSFSYLSPLKRGKFYQYMYM